MDNPEGVLKKANQSFEGGRFESARELYQSLLNHYPTNAMLLFRIAATWHQTGDYDKALHYYDKAIEQQPDRVEFHYNKGVAASCLKQNEDAMQAFQTVVRFEPGHYGAYNNLGMILVEKRSFHEAERCFLRAAVADPGAEEAWYNLGNLYVEQGDFASAEFFYHKTLGVNPGHLYALIRLGIVLKRTGRIDEAHQCFSTAARLHPDSVHPHLELGNLCSSQKDYAAALSHYQAVIERIPDHATALNNLGHIHEHLGDYQAAIRCYDKALTIHPDSLYHYNKGICLQFLNDHQAAVQELTLAIEGQPDDAQAYLARAQSHLVTGSFEEGWADYEWRIRLPYFQQRIRYPEKAQRWDGAPLSNATLCVYGEQGFGDTLQFIRYLPLIRSDAVKTLVVTRSPLLSLLERFPGIDSLIDRSKGRLPFGITHYIELLSLPGLFGTTLETIPPVVPFRIDSRESRPTWKNLLSTFTNLKIGLSWAGSALHINDHNRSLDLDKLLPLLETDGVDWISLQKDGPASQIEHIGCSDRLCDLSGELDDFLDTALVMEQLDLVISVDTAVAHLAATLGRPTWILLPYAADWRWFLDRADSPWYPSVKLFRQPAPGDWQSVIDSLKKSLMSVLKRGIPGRPG